MADDLLLVGRVARPHGIRGQVIVNPETDFAEERFTPGQTLLVGPPGHTVARAHRRGVGSIRGGRSWRSRASATMNDAEALAGAELWMPAGGAGAAAGRDLLPPRSRRLRGARSSRRGDRRGERGRRPAGAQPPDRQGSAGDVMIPLVDDICVTVDRRGAADRGRCRRTGCSTSIADGGGASAQE